MAHFPARVFPQPGQQPIADDSDRNIQRFGHYSYVGYTATREFGQAIWRTILAIFEVNKEFSAFSRFAVKSEFAEKDYQLWGSLEIYDIPVHDQVCE